MLRTITVFILFFAGKGSIPPIDTTNSDIENQPLIIGKESLSKNDNSRHPS